MCHQNVNILVFLPFTFLSFYELICFIKKKFILIFAFLKYYINIIMYLFRYFFFLLFTCLPFYELVCFIQLKYLFKNIMFIHNSFLFLYLFRFDCIFFIYLTFYVFAFLWFYFVFHKAVLYYIIYLLLNLSYVFT